MKKTKFTLKVFMINKNHYEFKDNNSAKAIIDKIVANHKTSLHAEDEDLDVVKPKLNHHTEGKFEFYTYCYNQTKKQDYWKLFLPDELAEGQDFSVVEFSYVLFTVYKSNIYCSVGGSGFKVIQSFMDVNFGIDFYQHFAKPSEDILLKVTTRGVAGNISQKDNTFNYDQRISESLEYSEIPKKIKIVVREELKKGIFKNFKLNGDKDVMEIGSYFSLRKKLSFKQFKKLIKDIHKIRKDKSNYVQLTLFSRVEDEKTISELDNKLMEEIVDDVVLHNTPADLNQLNDDIIEMVNPKKLEKFYECDEFKVRFKRTWSKNDRIVSDRRNLYKECTNHIFQNINDINDRFNIKGKFYDLNVIGLFNSKESTYGTFFSHIICELTLNSKKYFRIDANWYYLDDRFLKQIKKDAINTYTQNELEVDLLKKWKKGWDEDKYNKKHKKKGYYVLDKLIKDNIELCDILIIKDNTIYMIHVKDGFNTQMRNLYIQVILSAKRLWNDIYNNTGSSYLVETLTKYNKENPTNKIDGNEILDKILNDEYKIEFVMAYRNYSYDGESSLKKIELSQSNIAKYSLVQTVREMRNFRRFGIKVIDISGI
jgi:uncharacterized protein (TIGR04141 family)|tara:strand:+ start:329 stop:2116 length:1788 start_codon:yes stop_codon:yes gene_type:complete